MSDYNDFYESQIDSAEEEFDNLQEQYPMIVLCNQNKWCDEWILALAESMPDPEPEDCFDENNTVNFQ